VAKGEGKNPGGGNWCRGHRSFVVKKTQRSLGGTLRHPGQGEEGGTSSGREARKTRGTGCSGERAADKQGKGSKRREITPQEKSMKKLGLVFQAGAILKGGRKNNIRKGGKRSLGMGLWEKVKKNLSQLKGWKRGTNRWFCSGSRLSEQLFILLTGGLKYHIEKRVGKEGKKTQKKRKKPSRGGSFLVVTDKRGKE